MIRAGMARSYHVPRWLLRCVPPLREGVPDAGEPGKADAAGREVPPAAPPVQSRALAPQARVKLHDAERKHHRAGGDVYHGLF